MGIHFFKNAAFGGDWILQEKMVRSSCFILDGGNMLCQISDGISSRRQNSFITY